MKDIKIADKIIGDNYPTFIIAEAGCNHNGDLELAKKLIDVAVEAKADAVKFQTFITEKETTKYAPKAKYAQKATDDEESQYDMLKNMELSDEEHEELKKYSDEKGIIFFSTPYEVECVDLLVKLGVPAMKISSGELNNPFLVEKIAKTNLPVILSTGMASMEEIKASVNLINKHNDNIIVLHCTSNYPSALEDVNMRSMYTLRKELDVLVGYSDHTQGILTSLIAVANGACVIEKHITTDKNLPGPDHQASLDSEELKEMVSQIRLVETIMGSAEKKILHSEKNIREVARRSAVPIRDIEKGETITLSLITFKKPGTGISPDKINEILDKKANVNISKDELITWDMLK